MGDGGTWLRTQYFILSKNTSTPIPFWLSLPLSELGQWIEVNNNVVKPTKT